MNSNRAVIAVIGLLLIAGNTAIAQTWPSRPVKIIIPGTPGDGADLAGRVIAQKLQERLGQPFVVDNRPGAGSIIGSELAKNAPPDGYTYIIGTAGSHGINAAVYSKLPPTLPFVKSGQLRALAVTTLARSPELPEVPTVAESGYPGFAARRRSSAASSRARSKSGPRWRARRKCSSIEREAKTVGAPASVAMNGRNRDKVAQAKHR